MFLHSLGRLLHSSVCIRGTVVRSNTAGRSAEEQIREVFQLVFHSKYKTNNYDNNQQYKRSIQITPAHQIALQTCPRQSAKHPRSPPRAGFLVSGYPSLPPPIPSRRVSRPEHNESYPVCSPLPTLLALAICADRLKCAAATAESATALA